MEEGGRSGLDIETLGLNFATDGVGEERHATGNPNGSNRAPSVEELMGGE